MADSMKAEIVNYTEFNKMIDDFLKIFGSAKVPLTSVLTYWHKWNETNIFGLSGPGKYKDLTEAYKDFKEAAVGFIYPILKFDGVLEKSLTTRNSAYSVVELTDTSLLMGTSAVSKKGKPYPLYLNNGMGNNPVRPVVIKTPDQLDNISKIFFESMYKMMNTVKGLKGSF